MSQGRKVKIRPYLDYYPSESDIVQIKSGGLPAAYVAYREAMTYRWSFICRQCYTTLDNRSGGDEIDGRQFNIAGASRGGKAATVDEGKYRKFLQKEIARLTPGLATWLRWNSHTVLTLAQAITAAPDLEQLPVLADALEETGCTDPDLLAHCRFVGQHFRASWVVEMLLLAAETAEQSAAQPG
jgi:hypothetical protein